MGAIFFFWVFHHWIMLGTQTYTSTEAGSQSHIHSQIITEKHHCLFLIRKNFTKNVFPFFIIPKINSELLELIAKNLAWPFKNPSLFCRWLPKSHTGLNSMSYTRFELQMCSTTPFAFNIPHNFPLLSWNGTGPARPRLGEVLATL